MATKGGYDFYLKKMLLPIAPQKLQIKINGANETLTLINEGEINILKAAALTDVEFEFDIPQVQYPFATYSSGFQDASYFLNYLEELKTSKEAFQFIVSRTLPNGTVLFSTNIKVSMEDYTLTENASNGLDITVKVKLRQYREYSTKTANVTITTSKPKASTTSTRSSSTTKSKSSGSQTYTIKSGDTLWAIAKKYYGSGSKYTKIYNANKSTIESAAKKHGRSSSSNGHWIYPGTKLTIPS